MDEQTKVQIFTAGGNELVFLCTIIRAHKFL